MLASTTHSRFGKRWQSKRLNNVLYILLKMYFGPTCYYVMHIDQRERFLDLDASWFHLSPDGKSHSRSFIGSSVDLERKLARGTRRFDNCKLLSNSMQQGNRIGSSTQGILGIRRIRFLYKPQLIIGSGATLQPYIDCLLGEET
jgi:hypothetical protein